MRLGNNPLKGKKAKAWPEVMACVITHLPNLNGYHKHRFDVVQECLETIRNRAERYMPVWVWDNASGDFFRDWLIKEYRPEMLTLSPNYGKASARTAMIRTVPLDTVVCISDDDMHYEQGWFAPQLELLNGFPNVGVVSGYPVRTQALWGTNSNMAWAESDPEVTVRRGRFIPDQWEHDFAISVGRDPGWHADNTKGIQDTILDYRGMSAYATAHHCQFITRPIQIGNLCQWDGEAVSNEVIFDRAVDDQGLLRLTTLERLCWHMGNVPNEISHLPEFVPNEAVTYA